MTQHISSKNEFEQILRDFDGVILVDFFATRCGPCKMLAPVMEELSNKFPQTKILKIDVDEVWDLAQEFWISSIPTVFIWKNHTLLQWFMWAYPQEFYESKINELLQ